MTIPQLRYFIKLADVLHFTKAADELFISQPSLSTAIRRLEEELRTTLFYRKGKRVLLTPTGQILYSHATVVVDQITEAEAQIKLGQKNLSGTVSIAATYTVCQFLMPELLVRFYSDRQNENIVIHSQPVVTISEMLEGLRNGTFDYIISYLYNESLDSVPLHRREVVLALPRSHPLAEQETINFSSVINEPFVVGAQDGYMYKILRELFAYYGVHGRIAIQATDIWTLLTYVSLNFGIALVPKTPIQLPNVVYRPYNHPSNYNQLYLSSLRNRPLNPVATYVKDFLLEDIRNTPIAPTIT